MLTNILSKCGKNKYNVFLSLRGTVKITDKEISVHDSGFCCCLKASLCINLRLGNNRSLVLLPSYLSKSER